MLELLAIVRDNETMLLRATATVILVGFVLVSMGCASKARKEAEFLQAALKQDAKGPVETKISYGTSTAGIAIQTVTISFLIDIGVLTYRDTVNALFLSRGYTQAMNLSTPNEFSIAYGGLDGKIYVEILAEVALPSAAEMTQLPEEDMPKEPSKDAHDAPTMPPSDAKPPISINGIGARNKKEKDTKPKDPKNIHRVTIKISY